VISGAQLLGFMAASLVMIIIPGPGVLFVIGRALAHGRRTALATAVGHAAGNFVVAAFVAVGLGAILQRSATAFVVVKVIGAAYLVWLGIQAIRHRKSLAGAFAADRYGLAVIAPDVHDRASAVTRFVVVSPPGPLPARTGADRTSVAAFLAEDHPGALLEILTEFAVRGVNLTTIQSRPTGDRLGQYYFFIDCEGHVDDARVGEALMGLRRVCREVRFLGSYARCDGGSTHVRPGTSDGEFADAAAWLGRLRFGRP